MTVMISKQSFSLAEANHLNLVGGKAYALGKMIRAGFNVPSGFVLSVSTFTNMTPALKRHLLSRFDELQMDFVAVRSSAVNEDGKDDAWAGQLDTLLNCNRNNLLISIEQCWESVDSIRAQSYAKQKAIHNTKVAVIVQEMIQSEISGVAFSVHPISNNNKQVVIEAGFGLGEAVVSGQVTPDTYIVDKKTGQSVEKYVSQQSKKLTRNDSGATVWEDIGTQGRNLKLTDEQIAELCNLTSELEAFFKYPVDVEWALSDGDIYILQCRPITTLSRR